MPDTSIVEKFLGLSLVVDIEICLNLSQALKFSIERGAWWNSSKILLLKIFEFIFHFTRRQYEQAVHPALNDWYFCEKLGLKEVELDGNTLWSVSHVFVNMSFFDKKFNTKTKKNGIKHHNSLAFQPNRQLLVRAGICNFCTVSFSSEMRRWWWCSWKGVCQYNPRFLLKKSILSLTCGGVVQSVCTSGAQPSWRDLDGKCFEFFNRVKFFFRLDRCPPTRVLPPELMSRGEGKPCNICCKIFDDKHTNYDCSPKLQRRVIYN